MENIVKKGTLKWIFVGGKGGVGKTTVSSSLAVELASKRESVLIISTDPAHNLSDAFGQKFTRAPTKVRGIDNLFAMEIDPTKESENAAEQVASLGGISGSELEMLREMANTMPGIDEAVSFAEVMKQVQSMEFSVILFDTAPTGHTLRFLSFPSVLEKSLGKMMGGGGRISQLFQQVTKMMGDSSDMLSKLEDTKKVIEEVNTQFSDPSLTTFICVCIPEFLSLYETERLVQELTRFNMDTETIVVNQVLFPAGDCGHCIARSKMQQKYIEQIEELYEDFSIVKLPLLSNEVRGLDSLQSFSHHLFHQYQNK